MIKRTLCLLVLLFLPVLASASSSDTFQYAVPQDDTMETGASLRVDFMMNRAGRVILTVVDQDGKQAARLGVNKSKDVPTRIVWDGASNGVPVPPGTYTLYLRHERDDEKDALVFPLTITEKKAAPAIDESLPFLPKSMTDEDVWAAMQAPVFVADVDDCGHQKIYTEPSKKSAVAGKVHGQTQALKILSAPADGFVHVGFYRHEDAVYTEGYIPESALICFTPNTHYGLLLDKNAQTMTIYIDGKPFSSFLVTTGQMVAGDLERETRAGAFLISDRLEAFISNGNRCEYPLGFDGGNRIHQITYPKKSDRDFTHDLATLGQKDSHGCVRVISEANAEGVNAQWLYEHIPYHTKVLVLDDQDARESRMREIGALPSLPAATSTPAPVSADALTPAQTPAAQADSVVLTIGGDCVLGSEEKTRASAASFDSFIEARGYAWPFSGLQALFSSDDITFVNLECVLKDNAKDKAPNRMHNFRAPTAFANILTAGGVELVNIANNHYIDYSDEGKKSTRAALQAAGVQYSGYGFTAVMDVRGHKIGFGGIRETIYKQSAKKMDADIKALREQGCEVVIYTCHFGTEYHRTHNALQTEMAHRAIDAGADIVIGHHPHVVQGVEVYQGRPIFYSIANLSFGGNLLLTEIDATLLRVSLEFSGNSYLGAQIQLLPVLTTGSAPANDFRPVPAEGEDKARILKKLQDDTAFALTEEPIWFPVGE